MNTRNWEEILSAASCQLKQAREWAPSFAKYSKEFGITTPERIAAFVANIVVESSYLRVMRENLRYSAKGLANTWPNRYSSTGKRGGAPNAKALEIAGNQIAIANHCYANRMGNGDEASGDGWRYVGKGPIQLTGKDNVLKFFKAVGLPTTTNTEELTKPDLGARSAMWFWYSNGINANADKLDFDGCCDKVNIGHKTRAEGDAHGFAMRKKVYQKLLEIFKNKPNILVEGASVFKEDEMEKVIAPEITFLEEDPDREFYVETVKEYTKL